MGGVNVPTTPHMLMGWRHSLPLHQQLLPPRPSCCDIDPVQLQFFSKHLQSTTTTITTPFETDEAERHGRVLLMLQLRYTGSWTDEAMDDADAHLYTTTIIMHGEREAKTEDDDHSSLIGGTPAS